MKKAQILSALALAFALGVVAPVSGVINSASVSAYSDADGTATLSDANNAIAFVENNATYKAYVKIQNAIRDYDAGVNNGTVADLATNGTTVNVANDVYKAIDSANAVFGYNTSSIANNINNEPKITKKVDNAIAGAKTSELYNALAGVLAVLDDNKATDAQLVQAATKVRTTVGWTDGTTTVGMGLLSKADYDNLHPEEAKLANYRGANNPYSTWGTYADAKNIYDAVVAADEALVKYYNGYDLFVPLLVESGLLSTADINTINTYAMIQPSGLYGLATGNIVRGTQWAALYTEVQNAKEDRVQENSGDNYSVIGDLAAAWKAATGNEEAIKVVMARMAAYKAPTGTGDGSNNENNGGNKAPDTGILADAEGSASTTVAMVAGVATALTAAGAGVVAYRNARRSTRK